VAAGVGYVYASQLPLISTNEWHYFAVAYDQENAEAIVFYDGQTQKEPTLLLSGLKNASLGGSLYWSNNHEIDGLVDEVFIFVQYLTAAEIDEACTEFRNDK